MIVEETTKHGGIVRLQWDSNEINFTNLICLFDLVWGVEILNMGEMGETDRKALGITSTPAMLSFCRSRGTSALVWSCSLCIIKPSGSTIIQFRLDEVRTEYCSKMF